MAAAAAEVEVKAEAVARERAHTLKSHAAHTQTHTEEPTEKQLK